MGLFTFNIKRSRFGQKKKKISVDIAYDKLLSKKTSFAVSESYGAIRANLLYTGHGDSCNVFAVTGADENTGKTLTCLNVAISFANMGKRVLIIDADMRNPSVNRGLSVKTTYGLSERLARMESELPLVLPTSYENLFVICAGRTPPNTAGLLFSDEFDAVLNDYRDEFDYIFIDTPPVNVVSDALMIAKKVDGYIFVVRSGIDERPAVQEALEKMENVGGKVLGFILNDVNSKTQGYKGGYGKYGKYGKYGYGKYGKYGKYEQNSQAK